MPEKEEIPSRLARRAGSAPARGLGSGFAENQKMAGAQDPVAAARLAAADPSEVSEAMEAQEKAAQEITDRREELLEAIISGKWEPPQALPPGATWAKVLARQDAKFITDWSDRYRKMLDEQVEKDDEANLKETINASFTVQPDDPLYDPMVDRERRKRIEANLKALDFESMVFLGHVEQEIEVQRGLNITLRTLTTQHGLWIEYYIAKQPDMSTQNLRHTYSLMQVAVSLEAVNGKKITPSLEKLMKQDQRDEFIKGLEQRLERLCQMPSLLTDDFIIQYIWFTGRVRKLLSGNLTEKVGNS